MRKSMRRTAAATGVLLAGAMLPLVATAPAQASTADCTAYLSSKGYIVGKKVLTVCEDWATSLGGATPPLPCMQPLQRLGVKASHAEEACNRAQS
ncbi:hypothetical protein [Streptomyces sp. NPDC048611]|uniref:hypothetical protein n=1 Tax=unclassified Streptomyces TaxID=2593676 RepID=UPI00342F9D56